MYLFFWLGNFIFFYFGLFVFHKFPDLNDLFILCSWLCAKTVLVPTGVSAVVAFVVGGDGISKNFYLCWKIRHALTFPIWAQWLFINSVLQMPLLDLIFFDFPRSILFNNSLLYKTILYLFFGMFMLVSFHRPIFMTIDYLIYMQKFKLLYSESVLVS